MTGLSNHALSGAPKSPLLMLFEDRPMGTVSWFGLSMMVRSAMDTSPLRAFKVTFASQKLVLEVRKRAAIEKNEASTIDGGAIYFADVCGYMTSRYSPRNHSLVSLPRTKPRLDVPCLLILTI
jgi:predicted outer membrane repeat protein